MLAYFLGTADLPRDPDLERIALLEAYPGIGGWREVCALPSKVARKMQQLVIARAQAEKINHNILVLSFSTPCSGMVPPATADVSVCVVLIGAPRSDAMSVMPAVLNSAAKPCV